MTDGGIVAQWRLLSKAAIVISMHKKVLLLTNDSELECAMRSCVGALGHSLVVGREPGDGARIFASDRDRISGVVVDLDNHQHGPAWLSAMSALAQKIPAVAISQLDPRFLKPLASRHGAHRWLSKPAKPEELLEILKSLLPAHCNAPRQTGTMVT